jgi:hypothetical protein
MGFSWGFTDESIDLLGYHFSDLLNLSFRQSHLPGRSDNSGVFTESTTYAEYPYQNFLLSYYVFYVLFISFLRS